MKWYSFPRMVSRVGASQRRSGRLRPNWGRLLAGVAAGLVLGSSACDREKKSSPGPAPSASAGPDGLTPELRAKVLAQVGDRTITLGDYAEALARMDRFERLRYQSADRRRRLLEEMINLELLAREAERRGLDKRPETQELLRQFLRDELLRRERDKLPKLEDIPNARVQEYYRTHRNEFREPERRRVGQIVVKSRQQAEAVLGQARAASPREWGRLVEKYSPALAAAKGHPSRARPLELAGDVGLVSAPGEARGENPKVVEPVRAAVFELREVGEVLPRVVPHAGRFYIVRLMGKSPARDRTLAEAERTIRIKLMRDLMYQKEQELEQRLRKEFKVEINQAALDTIELSPSSDGKP